MEIFIRRMRFGLSHYERHCTFGLLSNEKCFNKCSDESTNTTANSGSDEPKHRPQHRNTEPSIELTPSESAYTDDTETPSDEDASSEKVVVKTP